MHELWLGVCPEAELDGSKIYKNQFPYNQDHIQQQIATSGEQTYIQERGERALEVIANKPLRYMKLVAARIIDYWLGTIYTHLPKGSGGWPKTVGRAMMTLYISSELVILIVCTIYLKKIHPDIKWLVGMIMLYSTVYCLTHMHMRFRAPAEPIMAVILGIIISDVWQQFKKQQTPR